MVSVIIPVYNSEKYLEKCIKSILKQSYKDFEIIIVNDGSTDRSYEICEKYAKKSNNIKLFSHNNRGVSYSRNVGIEKSSGDYLLFVDSDDWLEENAIKILMEKINENVDMVIFNYYINEREIFHIHNDKKLKSNVALQNLFKSNYGRGYLWNKIYKKEIIEKNNLRFDEKIAMCEDLLFNYQYILCVEDVLYIKNSLYHYKYVLGSSSHSKVNERYLSLILAYNKILDLAKETRSYGFILKKYIKVNIRIKQRIYYCKELKKYRYKVCNNIKNAENRMNIFNKIQYVVYDKMTFFIAFLINVRKNIRSKK